MEQGDAARQSELLVGLRGKISGCSGSIDLRGHLGPVSALHNSTRSEHGSLLAENARLTSNNHRLIAYVKEFESKQSAWLQRISFLEEERKAMEIYIGRVNNENKMQKICIQERDAEILRIQSLLPQIQDWKNKFEVSQAEVQRLNFTVKDLSEQLRILRINYESQIKDLRAEIQVFSRRSSSMEILNDQLKMDYGML